MRTSRPRDAEERREDALRPSPYLGYDRVALGIHLMERGALDLAEPQFRRAIWLNPYERGFRVHLAHCLWKREKREEARRLLDEVLQEESGNGAAAELLARVGDASPGA